MSRRRSPSAIVTGFYAGLFALVLNVTFLGSFYGWHLPPRGAPEVVKQVAVTAPEQPAVKPVKKSLEFATAANQMDLPVTVVEEQAPEAVALADMGQDVDPPLRATSHGSEEPVTAEDEVATSEETPSDSALPEGVPAMLRASDKGVEIGNFKSVTMSGGADECLAIGQSLANSVKGSQLDVMVSSRQITIAKICASNGAVFLTCRSGQISISPRRVRPDSRCDKGDA